MAFNFGSPARNNVPSGRLFGSPARNNVPSGGLFGRPAAEERGHFGGFGVGNRQPSQNYFGSALVLSNNITAPNEHGPRTLDWRGDPNTTFSDWTIELVDIGSGATVRVFHVHRQALTYSHHRSEYFANLFQGGGRFNESADRTSRIRLDELSTNAFPKLLDHLYGLDGDPISTDMAVALLHLAGYFQVPSLLAETMNFMTEDFSTATIETYYRHAKVLQDDTTMTAIQAFLADHLEWARTSALIQINDHGFWLGVLTKASEKDTFGFDMLDLSRLVATYCMTHRDQLDNETFRMLTDESVMPVVAVDCALALCELDDSFGPTAEDDESVPPLGDLQVRCAHMIAANMSKLVATKSADEMTLLLSERTPEFLATVIVQSTRPMDNSGFRYSSSASTFGEPTGFSFGGTAAGGGLFGAP